jgi:hypothetical protein
VSSTFWIEPRFTGIALLLGCLLFMGGAGLTPHEQGTSIVRFYGLSQRAQVLLISRHPRLWKWGASLLISGTIVTTLGFGLLTTLFRAAGECTFSSLGVIALLFGSVLWVITLAVRLGIDPLAAQETAKTGVLPDYYILLKCWVQVLFVIYTILAFSALAAYGWAVLSTPILPRWVGWTAIAYGLAGLGLLAVTKDAPPFLHYLMPLLMGILLLL